MAGGSKLPKAQDQAGGWPQAGQPQQQQQPPTGYGHPPGEHGAAYGQAAPPACGSQPPMGATGYAAPPSAPPSGYGYGAPQAHQAPGGYGQAPGGYGQAPGGYGQAPGGYGQAPGGYGQAPGGYGVPPAYGQPQQQYPPVQQGYPPAGVPGFPPGTDPQVAAMFQQADGDRSGSIDANELGRVLSTGRVPFSPRTLRLMLHLFSDNKADPSRIGPAGFAKLWKEIQQWNKKFHEFDRDNSGSIEVAELSAALLSFNFNIPPTVLQMLVAKYDVTGGSRSIGYDNFVECGLIVKGLTQKFKDQDRALSGNATFDYTSFMLLVIPFVAA